MAKTYLVQEEDGVSRFILEEGDGFLLLDEWQAGIVVGGDEPVASVTGGSVAGDDVEGGDRAATIVVRA